MLDVKACDAPEIACQGILGVIEQINEGAARAVGMKSQMNIALATMVKNLKPGFTIDCCCQAI